MDRYNLYAPGPMPSKSLRTFLQQYGFKVTGFYGTSAVMVVNGMFNRHMFSRQGSPSCTADGDVQLFRWQTTNLVGLNELMISTSLDFDYFDIIPVKNHLTSLSRPPEVVVHDGLGYICYIQRGAHG